MSKKIRQKNKFNKGSKAIGGWLVVFLLGIISSILLNGLGLIGLIRNLFIVPIEIWSVIIILLYIALEILMIYALILMFKRCRAFINISIFMLYFNMGILLVVYAVEGTVTLAKIGYTIVIVTIWIFYLQKTKRVKDTFIK